MRQGKEELFIINMLAIQIFYLYRKISILDVIFQYPSSNVDMNLSLIL